MDIEEIATHAGKATDFQAAALLSQIQEMELGDDMWVNFSWEGQKLEALRDGDGRILIYSDAGHGIYTFNHAKELRKYGGFDGAQSIMLPIGVCLIFGGWLAGIIVALLVANEPLRKAMAMYSAMLLLMVLLKWENSQLKTALFFVLPPASAVAVYFGYPYFYMIYNAVNAFFAHL